MRIHRFNCIRRIKTLPIKIATKPHVGIPVAAVISLPTFSIFVSILAAVDSVGASENASEKHLSIG